MYLNRPLYKARLSTPSRACKVFGSEFERAQVRVVQNCAVIAGGRDGFSEARRYKLLLGNI